VDASIAVAEVRELFEGNHDLIMGFNIFLPEEYQMDKKMLLEYDRATDIMNSIKVSMNIINIYNEKKQDFDLHFQIMLIRLHFGM
jgi:Paired amphipathic helix repeat